MTGDDTGVVELVQYAVDGGQANLFTHINQAFV